MVNMKKEQLGSVQKSQRLDFYNFLVTRKPSNVTTFVSNVVTLLINFQQRRDVRIQRRDVVHPNPEHRDVAILQHDVM